ASNWFFLDHVPKILVRSVYVAPRLTRSLGTPCLKEEKPGPTASRPRPSSRRTAHSAGFELLKQLKANRTLSPSTTPDAVAVAPAPVPSAPAAATPPPAAAADSNADAAATTT